MGAVRTYLIPILSSPTHIKEANMPSKGYKPELGRSAGMPEKIAAQHFNRRISAAEVQILHAAGFGSKTDGFRNLLDLYQELHNMGYRCDQPIRNFMSENQNKLIF